MLPCFQVLQMAINKLPPMLLLCSQVLHNITFGSIVVEDREELTPHHFAQLVPLAQCALDYALFQANSTGALLVGLGAWYSCIPSF